MTQCCILKRTRGSPVSQSYLYATCQGNSQMNELARIMLFKRDILRIWSQKTTHNCIRVLVQRALLAGEKLSDIISPCALKRGSSLCQGSHYQTGLESNTFQQIVSTATLSVL